MNDYILGGLVFLIGFTIGKVFNKTPLVKINHVSGGMSSGASIYNTEKSYK